MNSSPNKIDLNSIRDLIQQNKLDEAVKLMEQGQNYLPKGQWHFNLGVIYAKMGSWPLARYNFLQARKDHFQSIDLINNLDYVEEKLEISKIEKPVSASDYMVKAAISTQQYIWTTLSLMILFFGLFWFKRKMKFRKIFLLSFWVILPLLVGWSLELIDQRIVINSIKIQEGPSNIFPERGELPKELLVVTYEVDGWRKIIFPSKYDGWIKSSDLKKLE